MKENRTQLTLHTHTHTHSSKCLSHFSLESKNVDSLGQKNLIKLLCLCQHLEFQSDAVFSARKNATGEELQL